MRIARSVVLVLAAFVGSAAACSRVRIQHVESPPRAIRTPSTGHPEPADDIALAMPRLLQTINSERKSRGLTELRVDRGLALVAQDAEQEYQRLGRGFEQRVAARANADLRSFSLVFARVAALVVFVERFEHAGAVLEPAMDPEMRFVGLSVAKSPPPTSEQGGYAVVITMGR